MKERRRKEGAVSRSLVLVWLVVFVMGVTLSCAGCTEGGAGASEPSAASSSSAAAMKVRTAPAGGGDGKGAEALRRWIRPPAVAGAFYPADPRALRKQIDSFLHRAASGAADEWRVVGKPDGFSPGRIAGMLCPHAGYVYSGPVAACSYVTLRGAAVKRVIILGPSHHVGFDGFSVWPAGAYATPLGLVPVDTDLASDLLRHRDLFTFLPAAHAREHSIEVQLPFLQRVLGDFTFVPVVVGTRDTGKLERCAAVLAGLLKDRRVLVVASSDLSHYHPYDTARKLDLPLVRAVASGDVERVRRMLFVDRTAEACGAGPLLVMMELMRRLGVEGRGPAYYANSGDTAGGKDSVVGYASVLFWRKKGEVMESTSASTEIFGLSDEEKKFLLRLARKTIELVAEGKEPPPVPRDVSPRLMRKAGAFVTLTRHGRLRGCIGTVVAITPLVETVIERAKSAAFEDPRFPPVTRDEVDDLEIEISVLSPFRKIRDISEIQVGKHGLVISKGFHRGLLLPQVAVEYGWNRGEFLEHTCMKAGLPPDAWKHGAEIEVFTAEIFNEKELGLR